MEARSLKFITAACAGELSQGSEKTLVKRVCTDSRQLQPGDLFVALAGENFDGHTFLAGALEKGAAAVVAEKKKIPAGFAGGPVIAVDDSRAALGRLAAEYRKDFSPPVVVVGGSNGKTTTKELIAAVLRQKLATLWSDASFNNDIGVPLTLLRLEKKHAAAVLEAGTNHPGELAPLVKMIRPRFGVITSIGREHLEFFGSIEGVAAEEGALAELLPADGKLFINADDEWSEKIATRTKARVVRVGTAAGDWRARGLRPDKQGVAFGVETAAADYAGDYRTNLLGRHQVVNALFAIALGCELGLSRAEIERGLAECRPPKMRLQLSELGGVRVLDDAYNANADSMVAALQTLKELPCKGRRVAVLGDMAELGAHSESAHEEVGRRAAELGVGQLFAVGKMASVLARGARAGGLNRVFEFSDVEGAATAIKGFLKPGDLMLLKASRSTRLERIADLLRQNESTRKN
jgi:UDP-N-acetylmuramoyl-tripeptide--D-alanyl-D-alanine ligase